MWWNNQRNVFQWQWLVLVTFIHPFHYRGHIFLKWKMDLCLSIIFVTHQISDTVFTHINLIFFWLFHRIWVTLRQMMSPLKFISLRICSKSSWLSVKTTEQVSFDIFEDFKSHLCVFYSWNLKSSQGLFMYFCC